MQFFYFRVIKNVEVEVIKRELKEIADYVSNTFSNLYFLLNSSGSSTTLKKLLNIPQFIYDLPYYIQIVEGVNNSAHSIKAYLASDHNIYAVSWVIPRLKVKDSETLTVLASENSVIGCSSFSDGQFLIWFEVAASLS
jgi:hypothetical protein